MRRGKKRIRGRGRRRMRRRRGRHMNQNNISGGVEGAAGEEIRKRVKMRRRS